LNNEKKLLKTGTKGGDLNEIIWVQGKRKEGTHGQKRGGHRNTSLESNANKVAKGR